MQKVTHSEYIAQKKPLAKQLLAKLNEKYQYASVLITDNYEKGYRASPVSYTHLTLPTT